MTPGRSLAHAKHGQTPDSLRFTVNHLKRDVDEAYVLLFV